MAKSSSSGRPTVRVGVFLPSGAQLLDTACVDVLAMMGYDYLATIGDMLPAHLIDLAPDVDIAYIASSSSSSALAKPSPPTTIPLTAAMTIVATHRAGDAAVAPGQLDIVLVPGPDPSDSWGEADLAWLAAQGAQKGTDVLSVCTGIFLCGAAGLLDGKTACGPRGLQGVVAKRFPGVKLVGERLRWAKDGEFWSSGGITNGNDLVAAYARQSHHFPSPVVEVVLSMADVGDRPQVYEQGQTAFTLSIVWQLVRAWFRASPKQD